MGKRSTVLVLGASGMLGNTVLRYFSQRPDYSTFGSVRSSGSLRLLPQASRGHVFCGLNVENSDSVLELFDKVRPDVVVNCIGVVKQLAEAEDPLTAIPINSLLPHRLLRMCKLVQARLVHISTDCVFAGTKGRYREDDVADARDLYGLSKLLGEVDDVQAITLRTSLIGHELDSAHGLLNWFLSQRGRTRGFTRAIFSGLPTVELARVLHDYVIPRAQLRGIYHVAADPISKHDLLNLVARVYGTRTEIEPDGALVIDRSLDGSRFREHTGYVAPKWPALVTAMREFG